MQAEVAVIGAGAAGLATAWRLADAGTDVLLVEQFSLGHDRGSSHGATRIFRFAYPDPLYVRMAQQALPLWRELGDDLLAVTGGIDLGVPSDLDAIASALRACGAEAELLSADVTARRWPWLDAGGRPALHSPDTGVIAAAQTLRALARRARDAGAQIVENTPVEQIVLDDDGVRLETPAGSVRARRAVVTAGAWTAPLLEPLGLQPALRVTREQIFYFDAPHKIIPFIDRSERFRYAVPRAGGAPGIKVAEHEAGSTTTAADRTFDVDHQGRARIQEYVRATLPGIPDEPIGAETCLYTLTANEDFLIDVHGPLVVASPCSGHGFKFAPLIGDILARLATDRDLPMSLSRFALTNFT